MNNDSTLDADLSRFTDYLAAVGSQDERLSTEAWIAQDAERQRAYQALARAWENVPRRQLPGIAERITKEVGEAIASGSTARKLPQTIHRRQHGWMVGGITLALVGACVLVTGLMSRSDRDEKTHRTGAAEYRIYTTAPGQRATVELGDGTQVILNVDSRLEVARDFGTTNRSVRLIGQARFDVNHQTHLPFVVSAAGAQVTVLGTVFGVRAYDANVQVAVKMGKVAVQPCGDLPGGVGACRTTSTAAIVSGNEVLVIDPTGKSYADATASVDQRLAFSSGRLVLNDVPLREVLSDLNRWYDVTIQLEDPTLGNVPLRGELTMGTAEDVARMLELTLKAKTQLSGKVLRVFP